MCRTSLRPVLNVPGEPEDTKEIDGVRTAVIHFGSLLLLTNTGERIVER